MATAVRTNTDQAFQRCLAPDCGATYDVGEVHTSCGECGGLLDVAYDWDRLPVPKSLREFEKKWSRRNEPLCRSGVWRFHDLLPFAPPEQDRHDRRRPDAAVALRWRRPVRRPQRRQAVSCSTRA